MSKFYNQNQISFPLHSFNNYTTLTLVFPNLNCIPPSQNQPQKLNILGPGGVPSPAAPGSKGLSFTVTISEFSENKWLQGYAVAGSPSTHNFELHIHYVYPPAEMS